MIKIKYCQLKYILIKLDHNLKKPDTCRIQLTIKISFISFEFDNDEESPMHAKSNNIEIMISDEIDEVVEETF